MNLDAASSGSDDFWLLFLRVGGATTDQKRFYVFLDSANVTTMGCISGGQNRDLWIRSPGALRNIIHKIFTPQHAPQRVQDPKPESYGNRRDRNSDSQKNIQDIL
ncbi:hypothetical protein TNCV_1030431 [Trichonephila clavipes]|nr:hypothetical protein TNCV_1030431 [Trichonephila clavipes]